jgi:hypothetical protein
MQINITDRLRMFSSFSAESNTIIVNLASMEIVPYGQSQ